MEEMEEVVASDPVKDCMLTKTLAFSPVIIETFLGNIRTPTSEDIVLVKVHIPTV